MSFTNAPSTCSHNFPYWSVVEPSHCFLCGEQLYYTVRQAGGDNQTVNPSQIRFVYDTRSWRPGIW